MKQQPIHHSMCFHVVGLSAGIEDPQQQQQHQQPEWPIITNRSGLCVLFIPEPGYVAASYQRAPKESLCHPFGRHHTTRAG